DGVLFWGQFPPGDWPDGVPRRDIAREERSGPPAPVRLHDEPAVDRRLRSVALREDGAQPPAGDGRGHALASSAGGPRWTQDPGRPHAHWAATGPQELGVVEPLVERLRDGRFLAVLPIVELARRVLGSTPEPVSACFLFDDPNLHWPTYGHVRFAQLAREGARCGYHVAFATVPLDAWYTHPAARAVFSEHPDRLSLIIHGNEHVRHELGRVSDDAGALALARQALARIEALERRDGLRVGRVMAPPHGVCSETMAGGLRRAGFEALTVNVPGPGPPDALAGWQPNRHVAGGLPVLYRWPFDTPVADLALLSYLGHPIVLYGHHTDLAAGADVLGELHGALAAAVQPRWESLETIVRRTGRQGRTGDAPPPANISRRPRAASAWPVVRRVLVEARDRSHPLRARAGSPAPGAGRRG
ncbi:MAG: hypothetical protein ACR2NB_01300, partial [Solirubrobacteraceae bacterium]